MSISIFVYAQKTKHKFRHSDKSSPTSFSIQNLESPNRDTYQKPDKVIEYLGNLEGKTIADIGAGSGYFSMRLAQKCSKVIAIDIDTALQKLLSQRIKQAEISNIELRTSSHDSPMLAENEVDIVFLVNTYHHIKNRAEYFKKVKKGIKQDGKLVVVDFFKVQTPVGPPVKHKVSIDETIAELKEAGFAHFELEVNLLPYQFILTAK
ncbi:MAG: class I SAM-dependent methyltransferase [Bacteroidia bacterium]|nr:class I SAM-dependent methyltransferase [Bacteroidia bacterium]